MGKHSSRHIDHESCIAYYRDALSPQRAMRVRAYLESHPDEAHRARIDSELDRALARSLEGVLQEPVPPRLRIETRSKAKHWTGRLALVAMIVASAAVGWWIGGMPLANDSSTAFTERVVSAAQQPVSSTTLQTVARTQTTVPPPNLSVQGYRLVQQRRLSNAEPALIEFVYRNARGKPLRIYAETTPEHNTVPTVTSHHGVTVAQWREGGTRYALIGDVPKLSLQALAQAARAGFAGGGNTLAGAEQLQGAPAHDRSHHGVESEQSLSIMDGVAPVGIDNVYTAQPNRM